MRKLNKLMALVLSLVLCLSLAVTVSADTVPTNAPANGVYISKHLKVATGTTVPAATFKFTFTADTNNSIGLQEGEEHPVIPTRTVTYASGMEDTGTEGVVILRTDNILNGLTFPHAGVYAYTVSETANTYTIADSNKETMTYDSSEYTLRFYVENSTTSNAVEIKYVTIEKDGKTTTSNEGISTETTTTTDLEQTASNNFKFVNTYTKTLGDANAPALAISNTTKGKFADLTKEFTYTLNISKPNTTEATTYKYVVVNDNPVGEEKTGTYGENVTFKLDDGDTVKVYSVVSGSKYTLEQTKDSKYDVTLSVDSATATSVAKVENHLIDDDGSTADFTNTYNEQITPTGIELNNAPFMLMIGAAGIFMLLMLMSKKRREEA